MRRRRFLIFLALSTVLGGGVLFARRWLRYHLAQEQIAGMDALPVLSAFDIVPRSAWDAREPDHEAEEEFGFASEDNPNGWKDYTEVLSDIYHTVCIHHSADSLQNVQSMRQIPGSAHG